MKLLKEFYNKHQYKILFTTGLAYSGYVFTTITNFCTKNQPKPYLIISNK